MKTILYFQSNELFPPEDVSTVVFRFWLRYYYFMNTQIAFEYFTR